VRPDQRAKFNQQQQFVMARLADDHGVPVDRAHARGAR
jgi:hypothetical protein